MDGGRECPVDLHTADTRHAQVAEQDVGFLFRDEIVEGCVAGVDAGFHPHEFQYVRERSGDVGLIVDDDGKAKGAGGGRRGADPRSSPAGKRQFHEKTRTARRSGSNQTRPLWRSTMDFEMERPMPVPTPAGFVVK